MKDRNYDRLFKYNPTVNTIMELQVIRISCSIIIYQNIF
jgi:hypothetical protein